MVLKGSKRSVQLGEGCTRCPVRRGAWLEDSIMRRTEDQGEFLQPEQSYDKMTNCPGLPRTQEVLSTDKCQFKNRDSEKMGKPGLLSEQLPISGERWAAVLRCENN